MKSCTLPENNLQRGGYTRTSLPSILGISREFRIVRDNRVNQSIDTEVKPPLWQGLRSTNEQGAVIFTGKGSMGNLSNVRPFGVQISSHASNGHTDLKARHTRDANASFNDSKLPLDEKQTAVANASSQVQAVKYNNFQHNSAMQASSNSVVGVYSSSTDPVHVPSLDSRSSSAVGAIKREVGAVGGHQWASEGAVKKHSSTSSGPFSNSESFPQFHAISKTDQVSQTSATGPAMPSSSVSGSVLSNHYNSRPHQQALVHQKAPQQSKEWRPKSSQKSSAGVIGALTKLSSPTTDDAKELKSDAADLLDKLSQLNIHENQNVIIAQHIQVPESDRCRLTFGSLGLEFDSSRNFASGFRGAGATEESNRDPATSLLVSALESSSDDTSGSKQVEILDKKVRNSESDSSASGVASNHQLPNKSPSSANLDSYSEIGLVQENSPTYVPSETLQHGSHPELPNFSAYDPQMGYDISYFRPASDEPLRGHGLPSPQEALNSHTANSIPASSVPMLQQQQQPPMAQMYPQVHVSHFANLMPYRQFLSPVYVPQMAMPSYSSNHAYPHPSSGSSYLLMPGGGSHLGANGLKYGIQQFKPVPGSSPTGFGNFTSPTGYAINAPGVVGSANGLEDSSRIKYKDSSLYVPNQQAETSDLWIQNQRELSGLQSAPYYNLPGQTPHAAYLPSHTGHASFNAAAAQSSHMQFPGLYPPPPPQPAAMANPHHLGPVMGGGVGVAPAAPGAQVGAYQQPPLGHLNWTANF
uniref:Uncharacterized protein LOC105631409 isoform X2 n=1 Tax=Rhizophora mucronata TaxID=61149 RepID=A0A2P2LA64_RHIMU